MMGRRKTYELPRRARARQMLMLAVGFEALVLAGTVSAAAHAQQPTAAATSLVFDRVNVVDVAEGKILPDQRVVIVGNRIQAVGSVGEVEMPLGAQVVDARRKYLIPGLWDWHVHTYTRPDVMFPLLLANGVTGFREAGAHSLESMRQWRQEVLAGTRVGPPRQILSSMMLKGPSVKECETADYPACVTNPARARQLVDSFKTAGADMIKTYLYDSKALYFAVAAEARRVGIPFGGHVAAADLTPTEASDSGASIIDHVVHSELPAGGVQKPCLLSTATLESCRAMVEHFQRNQTWWVPTLAATVKLARMAGLPPLSPASDTIVSHFIGGREVLSLALGEPSLDNFKGGFENDSELLRYPIDSASIAVLRAARPDSLSWLRFVRPLKWPILAGTDANPGNPFIPLLPGFALHVELAVEVAEGLTPLEALQSATLNGAKFLHATDSMGTVAAGKLADLVVLDADPLVDITNTQRIFAVVANGRYFDRAALDTQLLAGKAALAAVP